MKYFNTDNDYLFFFEEKSTENSIKNFYGIKATFIEDKNKYDIKKFLKTRDLYDLLKNF